MSERDFLAFFKPRSKAWEIIADKYKPLLEKEVKSAIRLYAKEHGLTAIERARLSHNMPDIYVVPKVEWQHFSRVVEGASSNLEGFFHPTPKAIFLPEHLLNSGKFSYRNLVRHEVSHYLDDSMGIIHDTERRAFKLGVVEVAMNPASRFQYTDKKGNYPTRKLVRDRIKKREFPRFAKDGSEILIKHILSTGKTIHEIENKIMLIQLQMKHDPFFSVEDGQKELVELKEKLQYERQRQKGYNDALTISKRMAKAKEQKLLMRTFRIKRPQGIRVKAG
jgi:hypothetical protein